MEELETPSTYQQLRTDILEGNIEPESKLSIGVLAERYGSSAAPVREALSRLAAEGLVTRRGQRGYWAAPIDADEFVEVSRLREMLEVDAFRQSIRLGDLDWEAAIAGARHRELAVRAQTGTTDEDHILARTRENRRFHMALISACPSQWQLRFISTLYDQVPMPLTMIAWLRDFVAEHHKEEPFIKRKRDKKRVDLVEDGRGDSRIRQAADVFRSPSSLRQGETQ